MGFIELVAGRYVASTLLNKISMGFFASLLAILIYIACTIIYNLYFHPLAKFPGPRLAAISNIFYSRTVVSGKSAKILRALHDQYGDIVRWAPNELSFANSAAWKDIYSPRKSGQIFTKDPKFYLSDETIRAKHIVNTSDPNEHAQIRKMMSHAFSAKALLEQEDIVLKYADMLMVAIREESQSGPLNLTNFYNWVTFDGIIPRPEVFQGLANGDVVLGELAFSQPFGSVVARKTDDWISIILQSIKFNAYDVALYRLCPLLHRFMPYLIPSEIAEGGARHINQSKAKILNRMNKERNGELERRDFCSYIFEKKEEFKISDWQMAAHSNAFIVAGSETTATILSGMTYWLCRTPEVYELLKEEVRGKFKDTNEITSQTATLPYMTAVINETLRIYPPISIGMPRITPPGGEMVSGVHIPGGTTVGVHMWSVTHNSKNFKDPDTFHPERWLDPDCKDNLSASQPFLLGPRACMGQNMAWMEMRILIAKMVLLFDFELVDDALDWDRDGQTFVLWQKPDLITKVTVRKT